MMYSVARPKPVFPKTAEEIRTMPKGPEMDALVAVKAMGWSIDSLGNFYWFDERGHHVRYAWQFVPSVYSDYAFEAIEASDTAPAPFWYEEYKIEKCTRVGTQELQYRVFASGVILSSGDSVALAISGAILLAFL